MNGRILILAITGLCLAFTLPNAPSQAQTNPPLTSCGLPAGGIIDVSATYSLSADCTLTSTLYVSLGESMTINGNGHAIYANVGYDPWIQANKISPTDGRSVTLNQVTLDAQEANNATALNITDLSASQVTFRGNRKGIWDVINNHHGSAWSLANVLFLNNRGQGSTNGSALEIRGESTLTMHNVAFVDNQQGTAALRVDGDLPTVTATGCFTYVANYPRTVRGSWTDNSRGQCSGTLGNGYELDIPRARRDSCGFPTRGYIDFSTTFTLSNNCQMDGNLHIAEDITVIIEGNDHKIQGNMQGRSIWVAEGTRLYISDVVLEGVRFANYGDYLGQRLVFTGTTGRILYNYGKANFNQLMLKDLDLSNSAFNNAIFAYNGYKRGDISFADSMFMDISNGSSAATIWSWGSTIDLGGCISFINNIPSNTLSSRGGSINDRSYGPCPDDMVDEFPDGLPPLPSAPSNNNAPPRRRSKSEANTFSFYMEPLDTCPYLPPRVRVDLYSEGVQCQIVGNKGIGKAEVIAQGVVDAVDVWAYLDLRARVCFRRYGRTVLLDAAHAPRTVEAIPSYQLDGMTCVDLDRAGTVVLLYAEPQPSQTQPQPDQLGDCMVTTNYMVNLRDAPGGNVLDIMPYNITLTALEKLAGWYRVDFLGQFGWVSADYVAPQGACD